MQVLIIGGSMAYARLWASYGHTVVNSFDQADIIQFCGGEDVSPHLYGELPHPQTFYNTARDELEIKYFQRAVQQGKPCVGICRGGQFLNVVNGGKMLQHVDNHAIHGTHEATICETGEVVRVTSTHHQMMVPGVGGVVLVAAKLSSVRESIDKDGHLIVDTGDHMDIESVYYPDTNSLCFQPHPEFGGKDECSDTYFNLIGKYIKV